MTYDKNYHKKGFKMIRAIIICTVYILLALSGMSLIKYSHLIENRVVLHFLSIKITPILIIGLLLYGLSFLTFVFWVSRLQISIAIPVISGIHSGLVVLVGILLFNETVSAGQLFGILLVIFGTAIIGIKK